MSEDQHMGNLYQRFPVTIERGVGAHVWVGVRVRVRRGHHLLTLGEARTREAARLISGEWLGLGLGSGPHSRDRTPVQARLARGE